MDFLHLDQLPQTDWSSQVAQRQPTQNDGYVNGLGPTQMYNNIQGQRTQMQAMHAIQDLTSIPDYTTAGFQGRQRLSADGPHLEAPFLTPSPSPAKQLPQLHKRLQPQTAQFAAFGNLQDGKNGSPAFDITSNAIAQACLQDAQPQQSAQRQLDVSTSVNLHALTVEERIALNEAWKEKQRQRKGAMKNSQQMRVQSQILSPYATPQNTPQSPFAILPVQNKSFDPTTPTPAHAFANGANNLMQGLHTPSKLGQPTPRKTPQARHTSPQAKYMHNAASYRSPLVSQGGSAMSPQMILAPSAMGLETPRRAQQVAYTNSVPMVQNAAGSAQQTPIDLTWDGTNTMLAGSRRGPSLMDYQGRFSGQAQAQRLNDQQVHQGLQPVRPVNYQLGLLGHTHAVQGQKRSSADISNAHPQPYKRQSVTGTDGSPMKLAVQPMQRQPPVLDVQAQFEKQRQEAQKQRQQRESAAHKVWEARQVAQAQNAAKEQARQNQKREQEIAEQLRLEAERVTRKKAQAEKRAAAVQFKKDQQDAADFAEAVLKCKTEKLARERKLIRKQELRKDPSAIFRYYNEYIEFFPPDKNAKETRSQYHTSLLANRKAPYDTESDLALAIQYAHDNWDLFLEYPKQIQFAAEKQREKLARISAGGIQK